MLWVLYNAARSVAVDLPSRADSDPSATLYGPTGAELATGVTCARNGVNTTLAAGAALGAQQLTATSATGITAGARLLLGGGEANGGEAVTVKSVAGSVLTLVRSVTLARAAGTSLASPRVTFTVPAQTQCARGYRAEIDWTADGEAQPAVTVPFEVTRYALTTHLTIESVRDLDAQLSKRIPAGTWWPGLVGEAFAILQRRVAVKRDPGSLQGTIDLTTAHGYLVRALLAETAGRDFEDYRASMATRCDQEFESALAGAAWDGDGDGAPEASSRWVRSIKLVRS